MAAKGITEVFRQAEEVGVSRSTMFRWRSGGALSLDLAVRIAQKLNTPVEALFGPKAGE